MTDSASELILPGLLDMVWDRLDLVRVYTKPKVNFYFISACSVSWIPPRLIDVTLWELESSSEVSWHSDHSARDWAIVIAIQP